jgi:hypothetical protein
MDAAASFWREWIINYDVSHQRILGRDAATSGRQFFDEVRRWIGRQHRALLRNARRSSKNMSNFPVRWLIGFVGSAAAVIILLNLRRLVRGLRAYSLRTHPERAPREAAAIWYDRMVKRMARMGWRKSPSQTPLDFVAAIQEAALQKKVAVFTHAYESARFGKSLDDAQKLPRLFAEISIQKTASEKAPDHAAAS